MVELLPDELGRERRKHAATGPVVAAERGLCRVDDLAALPLRPGAGAQRHRVHVRHEQQPRLIAERAGARKIDDQVSGLGRHRYPLVGVIEPDRALRHAGRPQRRADLAPDQCLAAGHAFDRQKSHQALDGGVGVDGHGIASFNGRFCRGHARLPWRAGEPQYSSIRRVLSDNSSGTVSRITCPAFITTTRSEIFNASRTFCSTRITAMLTSRCSVRIG